MLKQYFLYIVIGILSGAVGVGVGYWIFEKNDPDALPMDYTKIDSLMNANRVLEDSINYLDHELIQVRKEKAKVRTKYDTITKYENTQDIINSLNLIINTPIQ